jgi:Fuc2NAc and GlcNAc transferase
VTRVSPVVEAADPTINSAIVSITVAAAAAICVLLLTSPVRSVAVRWGMVAAPEGRSSHLEPTPVGGGLAFVIPVTAAWFGIGVLTNSIGIVVIAATGVVLSWVGFEDDRRGLPATHRLAVQLAASAAVCAIAILPRGLAPGAEVAAMALSVLAVAWSTNLFNFMDGLDGLAASEGIFVASGGVVLAIATDADAGFIAAAAALAGALVGFLPWNAPKARIFMGDAGSTWLGFVLSTMAVIEAGRQPGLLQAWLLLPSLFVTDATVCLVRRLLRGENVTQGHRAHAYQNLSRKLGSHVKVVVTVVLGNLCLVPAIWICIQFPAKAWWVTCSTYALLCAIAVAAGSGVHGISESMSARDGLSR